MNAATLPGTSTSASWRRALLLMLTLSLLPIAVGAGLYFFGWRPAQTSNHGTLIAPPVAVDVGQTKGKWALILVDGDAERFDELRRVRAALAKEWQRTEHLRIDAAPAGLGDLPPGSVIIIDPEGRAMMRYAPGAELKGIRADLERLLKYSWIG